jgi:ABC-type transport system involved in multi-copper enzyme maturation permease subunit
VNNDWIAQVRGVLRLELRKNLLSARALPMYFLAAAPLALIAVFILVSTILGKPEEISGAGQASMVFSAFFQVLIIRGILSFGCVWLFMNLFRGEVLDRSLHYYFLAPIRREVLVAGKYLSAWLTTVVLFAGATIVSYVALYGYLSGAGVSGALRGTALGHLVAYVSVTVLGCLGYGAVFLVIGLFIRNPIIPAVLIFLWEGINGLLPTLLKKISVIHYLQSMMPVPVDQGPFAIIAEPVSAWLAVPGLIIFTGLTILIASLRIRHMEIVYASD